MGDKSNKIGEAMAMTGHEHQADLHRRVVSIIELLDGLPVGEAEHVLNETRRIMKTIVQIDTAGPGFAEMVRQYYQAFGDGTDRPPVN